MLIAVLTLSIVFLPDPEVRTLVSDDGLLTVSGLARQTQEISLVTRDEALGIPLVGRAYDVLPSGLTLDTPLTLILPLRDLGLAEDVPVHLYTYDETSGFWSGISEPVKTNDGLLIATTPSTGRYAVGIRQDVNAPEFLSMYDELRRLAPKNTRAYDIVVGYRVDDSGPFIVLPESGESGGCGGVFREGSSRVASELSRTAVVNIDDVATPATFVFFATWIVDEQSGGCPAEALLSPLLES